MVALATFKEFFGTYTGAEDDAANVVKSIIRLPETMRLGSRSAVTRQWNYPQSRLYVHHLTIGVDDTDGNNEIYIILSGAWRNYVDGLENLIESKIRVKLEDFRTSKEALEALCHKFVDRFQKPASQGNVQVFYDESKNLWSWKRPSSSSFCKDALGFAFNVETCMSVYKILGSGVVPDKYVILSTEDERFLGRGTHPDIIVIAGQYYFKEGLIPIYRNEIPFDRVHQHVPATTAMLYEYVIVNDERRYIDLKRPENSLLSRPVHDYGTRIESLVPANRMFLLGKTDLYAKRDKDEVPFLGWELEACSNLSSVGTASTAIAFKEQMPWLIMCKNDGSISPEGFETVSVPATLDFWQESNLSSALDSMRMSPHNMRSYEHSSCGFHVHVSRAALSVLDLQKLERFVHNPENNKFITTVAGRGQGTYQQYVPDLFKNRKRWFKDKSPTVSDNINDEDIIYFLSSWDALHALAENHINHDASFPMRCAHLSDYMSSYVSYASLNRIILANEQLRVNYSISESLSISAILEALRYRPSRFLEGVCRTRENPESLETQQEFVKTVLVEVLCAGRPKFSSLVKKFFPEFDLVVEEPTRVETPSTIPAWKIGLQKSPASYKRKNNLLASQIVKGPVGKGVNARYDALNTTNRNTVEFRMFKGTMNGTTIMRYLEFTDALVRFVANTSATDSGLHFSTFIKWLWQDSFNIARYEHLVSFITENKFLDRKEIRRKTLPTVISEDKNVTGLIASPAEGFKEVKESKPIGSFTLTVSESEAFEPPAMSEHEAEAQYDVIIPEEEEEDEDYGGPNCQCSDCREARGEY